jgi:hypothetical protein
MKAMHVNDDMRQYVPQLSQHMKNGGVVYICGAASVRAGDDVFLRFLIITHRVSAHQSSRSSSTMCSSFMVCSYVMDTANLSNTAQIE